eukprot:gene5190-6461_t
MKYKSTRGSIKNKTFIDAVQMGLADDQGLLVPDHIPMVTEEQLNKWRSLSYPELAFEIMSLYISMEDISSQELKSLIQKSYVTSKSFTSDEITPVRKVTDSLYVLELFHGPTYSFKDVALQFLGNLFELILERKGERLAVVAATSGDTGSASISGLRGKKGVDVFILYPKDRISRIQELQMISILDDNVYPIAITDSSFDPTQSIVKEIFGDLQFKKRYNLGAVNSINWARILAQIVYYFYSYFKVEQQQQISNHTDDKKKKISFSVPTGNFGDILAGYYAKRMGLPIDRLVVSTNENDILDRFFKTGKYVKSDGDVIATCTPSMDIKIASNFERYLYYLCDEDSTSLLAMMDSFKTRGQIIATPEQHQRSQLQEGWVSSCVSQSETVDTIREYWTKFNYLIDPHTAVGIAGSKPYHSPDGSTGAMICLATAHPAKFGDTVKLATNNQVDIESQFQPVKQLLQIYNSNNHSESKKINQTILPESVDKVKDFIILKLNR